MNIDPSPALLKINSHWHQGGRPWAQEVGSDWYCHCPSCEHRGEVTTLIDAMNQAIVHHYKCQAQPHRSSSSGEPQQG